ncbi:Leucine-rich repeat-containing protein 16B [Chelonia mydas]|uniref:Leucine-rich repeat-containing protein 16B n=1 Tax=Chelonia mydas TaxID=8469 RepID=M7B4Y3_CHEMY|nr:Leucine-rich repeat-containing protein 16B [Chelonia mydas]
MGAVGSGGQYIPWPAPAEPADAADSIRKVLSRPPNPLLLKVKLETKPKKFEDRVLVLTAWRLHLFGLKVPAKVESSFNVLEIRTLNTINHSQDVDTIYHSADNHEFNLLDFSHLESRDFALKLTCALGDNPGSALHSLVLSHNQIEDKVIRGAAAWMLHSASLPQPLPELLLAQLRSPGAQVLQEQLPGVTAVGSLDISDNGFDSDLLTLVPALGKNKSLKHLWLGKNFSVKSRTLEEILHKIVQLIQEEDCSLQSLSVADSRLKSRTSILINALGSNTCLSKVDLSGNGMEDLGAKMLSKALQINSSLRSIAWDRNNTTALGFHDVARALENNYTLKYMSFPMSDITAAYRSAPERTDEVWQKIQWCLLRNGHSQKFSQEQAFRLQQGIGTSSAEQMIRRLCLRVQEEVRALHSCPADTVQEEVLYARELMKEAKNSRALFPSLYELGHILASDGPVRQRLESVANEVSKAVDKELQVILQSLVTLTQELCPRAMQAAEGHNKMLGAVSERVTVPRNFIRGALLEQAGQDIQNKLKELDYLAFQGSSPVILCSHMCAGLHCQCEIHTHIAHLQQLSEGQGGAGSSGGTPLDQPPRNQLRDHEETTDDELGTSIDTIAIKRQKHGRKIRPVSAFIGGADPDTDATHSWGTNSPPSWLSSSASSQYSHSRSPSFAGLPPTEGSRREHRTRGRPRPPRCVPWGPRQNGPTADRSPNPMREESDSSEAELLQPSRVHGIALPGMGRSLDGKKEGAELQRVGSLQDRERRRSSDGSGGSEVGRKAAPLKPQRTRRAQSCDKLESDQGRDPGARGTQESGKD